MSSAARKRDSGMRFKPAPKKPVAKVVKVIKKRKEVPLSKLGPIAQIKESFRPRNRLAAITGLLLGGFVPLASYWIAHNEVVGSGYWMPVMISLVFGGLLYSAKTVYQWARVAFDCPWKAGGFVLLVEGVMIFSGTGWLGTVALSYLIGINAVASACVLAKKG